MMPVSLLVTFLYCPRKLYLQRVLNLSESPRGQALVNKIKDIVFSSFNEMRLISSIAPENTLADIEKMFKKEFDARLKQAIIEKKKSIIRQNFEPDEIYKRAWSVISLDLTSRVKWIWDFVQEKNKFGRALWEALSPKIKSDYFVESEDLGLKTKIDQILIYEQGIFPLLLRTGLPPSEGIWPAQRIQLASCMMLLEKNFQIEVKKGYIYYSDSGIRELNMNPFLRDDVINIKKKVDFLLNSEEIPPITKKESKCNNCNLKKKCHDSQYIEGLQQKTLNTT
ncbi:MAG: CRISPR-associated protein Cas4 [Nanobdellota archaeon]